MIPSILLIVVILGACAPASESGRTAPVGASVSGSEGERQAEWNRTQADAKQEGKLVLSGPPSDAWRTALTAFERDYPNIRLAYTGITSRDFWPRVSQEKRAGQHLWDLRVGGPDPQVFQAKADGILDPVAPLLVLRDVTDESKWFGAARGLLYADKDQRFLRNFLAQGGSQILVNRQLVPESAFRSARDLIDPRWKGKIVQQDPRGGSGLGALTVLLAAYGEDFVRTLLTKQEVVITGDNRQEAEWLVRGRYPIGIGNVSDELLYFERQGLQPNVKLLADAPQALSIGFGSIQVLKQAPHPNASKVFVNWLLTQKTQSQIAKTVAVNSLRLDASPGNPALVFDPKRIQDYVPHQFEQFLPLRQRAQRLAAELLK